MDDNLYALIHPKAREDIARAVIKEKWGIRNPPPVLIAMVSGTTYRCPNG